MAIFAVSSILTAMAASTAQFIVWRVLQGIGSAMVFSTAVAIVTSAFPQRERGKILGVNVASTYMGLSVGPFLGGVLTEQLGWRSIFYVNALLGMAIVALVLWKLKQEWAEAQGESFDFTGSLIYGAALLGLVYGFSLVPNLWGALLIIIGISGLAAFVFIEKRVESPILNMGIFHKNKVFVFSSIASLINYSATYAVGFVLSLYLQHIKGFDAQGAGMLLIVQPAIQAVLSPAAGRMSDRIEPQKVASLGMALTAVGLLLLVFLGEQTGIGMIIVILMVIGLGLALFSSPNTNAIMSSVEKRFYGIASGMVGSMRLIGQVLSVGIAKLVFDVYIGGAHVTPEIHSQFIQGVKVIFIILSILCVFGVFASLSRGELRG